VTPGVRLAALAGLCFLWAGMVLGISFLEAPVKFRAPSLTLPVGLDVGRQVFGAFSKVELALALLALLISLRSRPGRLIRVSLAVVVVIVAAQALWLLPLLDARVEVYLTGGTPRPAPYHVVYTLLEGLKLAGLALVGVSSLRAALRRERQVSTPRPMHRRAPRREAHRVRRT